MIEQLKAGIVTASAAETQEVAARLAAVLPPDATLALHGDLGVGKTTFVQGLAHGFGITEPVTSPTFTLYSLHRGPRRLLVHLDAYRLERAAQLDALMLEDFLVSPYCLAIEWPDNIAAWLPPGALHLEFSIPRGSETHRIALRRG
ncbi:MAG TPA: tRNA (adenosine(37)-N6)-threonylcarbamoyltransferase complex ATPase subunit type 1 TsaE [Opitutaceae bacterium]|nr:tRNA (adenosine(37)-N6)-threonylcarbamoyltransferase complex ATPase subunit type 1 TsaE [Opitutaceae bacterium]